MARVKISPRQTGNQCPFSIFIIVIPVFYTGNLRYFYGFNTHPLLSPYYQEKLLEVGCDEAGRGCLAGPVFAAAVVLPKDFHHPLLNDSKQVLEKDRYELRKVIEASALAFAVASVSNKEIDRINILKASFKAMHLALTKLTCQPGLILVDGNRFIKYKRIPHRCIIKGDAIFSSIAAASILAKTYRDDHMLQLHNEYPHYGWDHNKGYATQFHRDAIVAHGECKHHRKSFRLISTENELFAE